MIKKKNRACPQSREAEIRVSDASNNQIIPRIAGHLQKPERGKQGPFPRAFRVSMVLWTPGVPTSILQNHERIFLKKGVGWGRKNEK